MSKNRARSLKTRAADEEMRARVCAALRELAKDGARFSVKVVNGVVSLMGVVPNGLYLGRVADVVRSIPHVRELHARLEVA